MTSAEIVRELRATRPVAPAPLRARVLAGAAREPVRAPTLLERVRRHRLLVVVPAAAGLALTAAVAIGITRPQTSRDAVTTPGTTVGAESGRAGAADAAATPSTAPALKAGTAAAEERAQRITASLTLRVADGDALAAAARDAIRITRSLGGYVVRSDVAAGDDGYGSLSVRVPSDSAQAAIERLSALGTIVGQRVQADDLQGRLDVLETELATRHARLASVRARLASDDLTPAERATLRLRRDTLVAEIRALRAQRDATRGEAAEATIDVELRTERSSGIVPVPSRLDRTLSRALDVLAWEAVALLGLVVVLAPFALVGGGLWLARRAVRVRETERLLAAR